MGRIVLAAIGAAALLLFILPYVLRPDLGIYEQLRSPQINTAADRLMFVVELEGEPGQAVPRALSLLLNAYYRIPSVRQGSPPPYLRARRLGVQAAKYGIPVPAGTAPPAPPEDGKGPAVRLELWQYGEVGEILHVGPYRSMGPALERLEWFIRQKGYRVEGEREEEYLRGPGIMARGNPRNYRTILRYRVVNVSPYRPRPVPGKRS